MIKNKYYTSISAYLDIASILPQTPDTEFEKILYFNQDNNLDYLDLEIYTKYYTFTNTNIITNVAVSSNPPINQTDSTTNTKLTDIQVFLSSSLETIPEDLKISEIIFPNAENNIFTATIDPNGQYGYFSTSELSGNIPITNPSQIVKIDLNLFTPVNTLTILNQNIYSAIISPDGQFIYFGTLDGKIIKLSLITFTIVGTLTVPFNYLSTAVIDPLGNYAYFFSNQNTKAVKIDLVTFNINNIVDLESGDTEARDAIIDPTGQYAYFATQGFEGRIVKMNLNTFTRVTQLYLDPGNFGPITSAVMDPSGQYAYFATDTFPSKIYKVDLNTFLVVNMIVGPYITLKSAVIDSSGNFAYFVTGSSCTKVELSTFTISDETPITPSLSNMCAVINPLGNYIYAGTDSTPGKIVRINLSPFEQQGILTLNPGANYPYCGAMDPFGQYAYFGTYDTNFVGSKIAKIIKFNCNTFELADILICGNELLSVVIDPSGKYAYFGNDNSNFFIQGSVIKIDLDTFTKVGQMNFWNIQESKLRCAVMDPKGQYAYFASNYGGLVKINLNNFTRVDTIDVINSIVCGVIEPLGKYAYFANTTGSIIKIDLETFTQVGQIDLFVPLNCATIDPTGRYSYFGTNSIIAEIVKIDLSTFTFVNSLSLSGVSNLTSAVMSPNGHIAFFASSANIVKIYLNSFSQGPTIPAVNKELTSAVIQPQGQYAFFSCYSSPGEILRISTIDNIPISGLSGNISTNLQNTTNVVQIDNKSQVLNLTNAGRSVSNYYLTLYVKGRTGLERNLNSSCVIQTQLKSYN